MLIEILEPDFAFEDERGELVQLAREGYRQFNVVFSKGGVIRGNHYHKENNEVFYVMSGSFELSAQKDGASEAYVFKKGDMFKVPPFVMHSFNYLEDTWVAAMYDKGVEHADGTKDIYAENA